MIFNNRGPNCAERVVIDATSFLRVHVTNVTNRGSHYSERLLFVKAQAKSSTATETTARHWHIGNSTPRHDVRQSGVQLDRIHKWVVEGF